MVDLDIGRGLMMVILAFRHAVSREFPTGNDWYVFLYMLLNWFQMPAFMFISGIVMGYTFRRPNTIREYAQYVWKRFFRLIPAYVLFASLIFMGKYLFQQVTVVENPIQGFSDYLTIFLAPKSSVFASYLWFLYVLFAFYLLVSFFLTVFRAKIYWLVILALVLNLMTLPEFLALTEIGTYLIYFVLGFWVVSRYSTYLGIIDQYNWLFGIAFVAMCVIAVYVELPELVIALVAIPAVHAFCRIPIVLHSRFLKLIGDYMYPVYLMNTIPINVIRIVILMFISWNGVNFIFILPILMLSGLLIPIIVQKYIISRTPILNKIIY